MPSRPGGEIATRPLHFFWIVDCSGSMSGEKIQSLNQAIKDALPEMKQVARENVNAELLVRVLEFSSGVRWRNPVPTPVENFVWTDLRASGVTDMGTALMEVSKQLHMPPMSDRALPPVLVLLSDGQPTDNFKAGLDALMNTAWGRKSVRMAIAIGQDCEREVLRRFIGNSELQVLEANNPDALVKHIKWMSTVVVQAASAPPSQPSGQVATSNIPTSLIQAQSTTLPSANDVW